MLYIFLLATNINDAVLRGVDMLVKDRREKKLPERSIDMVILLTDGNPDGGKHAEDRLYIYMSAHLIDVLYIQRYIFACCVCVFEGESYLPRIQQNVRSAIGGNMSLFCLGFGNDVDYSFLDVMSKQNKGMARRIFEGSDATLQLQVEGRDCEHISEPIVSSLYI